MKKISKRKQVICENCGTPFSMPIEAYDKIVKENRPIYCSINCANHHTAVIKPTIKQENIIENDDTSFNFHYKELIQTNPVIKISISDLKNQWIIQNGSCYISSLPLKLTLNLSSNSIDSPMLIKKDKTKEWVKDNIMWVCKPIGLLSKAFNEDIYELLKKLN